MAGVKFPITTATMIYLLPALFISYLLINRLALELRRHRFKRQHNCKPLKHRPSRWPYLGLDIMLSETAAFKSHRLLSFADGVYASMGRHTWSNTVGLRTSIHTIEPENLKTMQATNFKHWRIGHDRVRVGLPLLGAGIFTTNGDEWHRSRDLLRPNFSREHVRDLESLEVHVQNLMERIPRDGETVDLQDLFFRLTMDSATELLFGESTGTLREGVEGASAAEFTAAFNRAQERMFNLMIIGPFVALASTKQYLKDAKLIQDFADTYVEKGLARRNTIRAASKPEGGSYLFLDELVRQTDDKIRIRSELLNILLAGRDTTASLLSNVWWMISRRRDVWAKLREEVDLLEGRIPDFNDLKEMKYLRAVFNESLRLYPVVPVNSRQATCDTVLPRGGGSTGQDPCFIRKGQFVNFSTYSMHRRKDLYGPDAEDFKPERWLNGLRPGWEYLPFNGGPRICIGQQFALTEASYVTVRMMQVFQDIQSQDDQPWTEWVTLTTVGRNGCKVSLTPMAGS